MGGVDAQLDSDTDLEILSFMRTGIRLNRAFGQVSILHIIPFTLAYPYCSKSLKRSGTV